VDVDPRCEKLCSTCERPIPAKRLLAIPNAEQCVVCLESSGDVAKYKRLDERTHDDTTSVLYTRNPYIDFQVQRGNNLCASDAAFEIAVGDDSFLVRERNLNNESGYSMEEAFECEDSELGSQPTPVPMAMAATAA
jgi:hypothetical protein